MKGEMRTFAERQRYSITLTIDCCPALTELEQPLVWGVTRRTESNRRNRLYVPLTGQLSCSFMHSVKHKPLEIHIHTPALHTMTRP